MTTETLPVPEVHCGHCVSSIEGALKPMDGVQDAVVDLQHRTVTVSYDDARLDRTTIVATIEDQGYQVGDGGDSGNQLPLA